jgi:hypothetical protein
MDSIIQINIDATMVLHLLDFSTAHKLLIAAEVFQFFELKISQF